MSAFRPTAPLLRRTTRTLPGEQRLNKKVRPETKPNLKDSRYLAPRLPKNKAGLRIRLISPAKGFNVKTVGYRIVVNDGYASPRRKPIEQIGNYDPRQRAYKTPGKSLLNDGETVYQKRLEWNVERLSYWIAQGAQPSPRLVWLMQQAGVCASRRTLALLRCLDLIMPHSPRSASAQAEARSTRVESTSEPFRRICARHLHAQRPETAHSTRDEGESEVQSSGQPGTGIRSVVGGANAHAGERGEARVCCCSA